MPSQYQMQPPRQSNADLAASLVAAFTFWFGALFLCIVKYVLVFPLLVISGACVDAFLYVCCSSTTRPLRFFPTTQQLEQLEDEIIARDSPGVTVEHTNVMLEVVHQGCRYQVATHAIRIPRKTDPDSAEVLLIIHGTAASSTCFSEILDGLSNSYNIVLLDLPGYGRTKVMPPLRDPCNHSAVDFNLLFIDTFMESCGCPRARVLGHSWGAYNCIYFAHRYTHRVSELIVMDSPGIAPTLSNYGAYLAFVFKYVAGIITTV